MAVVSPRIQPLSLAPVEPERWWVDRQEAFVSRPLHHADEALGGAQAPPSVGELAEGVPIAFPYRPQHPMLEPPSARSKLGQGGASASEGLARTAVSRASSLSSVDGAGERAGRGASAGPGSRAHSRGLERGWAERRRGEGRWVDPRAPRPDLGHRGSCACVASPCIFERESVSGASLEQ